MEGARSNPKLNWCQRIRSTIKNVIRNITVEPALFVMFLGFGLDHSTLDQMQIDKCCRDDFDFNETVCENITDDQYKDQYSLVSDEVRINHSDDVIVNGRQNLKYIHEISIN